MDRKLTRIDFAAIGHQDSWDKIHDFVSSIRKSDLVPLTIEEIKDTYKYIPPRKIFDVEILSTQKNCKSRGIYIETFISPDELKVRHFKKCLDKIKEAAEIAVEHNAGITALGGFTSIVLEGELNLLNPGTFYTTGNTLTTAFIIKSVETACEQKQIDLKNSSVMILGSTGDIGSALSNYFSHKCQDLLLCARNELKLKKQQKALQPHQALSRIVQDPKKDASHANIIISVASSTDVISGIKPSIPQIVCDAGYPKNLGACEWHEDSLYYYGGMGIVEGGVKFSNQRSSSFYAFPMTNIIHGCLLEAIVLGFEKRFESYSYGKGNITLLKIKEILKIAEQHGVTIAPYFNHKGLCQTKVKQ